MEDAVILVDGLTKQYSKASNPSLEDLSFSVQKGEKLGIFGPNGAGKTTLMSIMTGILNSSKGKVAYMHDGQEVSLRKKLFDIGYVPQDFSFFEELTAKQNLEYFGSLYGIPKNTLTQRIDDLLGVLGLSGVKNKKTQTFSGGMKRRLNLAIAIINQPTILFLDEPTVGVDVQSKNAIMAYLEEINKSGTTIIYTSHHMSEGQEFCNKILLIDHGQKVAYGTLEDLFTEYKALDLEKLFLQLTGSAYRD